MQLNEGGNVFKNTDGTPATSRINRADVLPTVQWLEGKTGLGLVDNLLGTTGKKDTSGDLDIAVNAEAISKEQLIAHLLGQGFAKADIKKSGDSVHLKTPINGDPKQGFVQTDFMFGNPKWMSWSMRGGAEGSQFKGMHRHILLASIAKAQGMKWSYKNGLIDRETNEVITQDANEIAKLLVGGTAKDLESVETILAKIKTRPDYQQLVADARDTLGREGLELPESALPGTANWFRTLSDRVS